MQRSHFTKSISTTLMGVLLLLLLGATVAVAQQQVNLTAGPTSVTLPDGTTVPMWGYSCGTLVAGSTATCAAANPLAVSAVATSSAGAVMNGWSPVVITVPTGQDLQINLTNNLSFATTASPNAIPTSLVIVGQIGGGLGGGGTAVPSPAHPTYSTSWPIANTGPQFQGPTQGARVQSFGTEVAAGGTTATSLTWTAPRAGTYLLESGTHPSIQVPMGLIGMVVVTQAPGTGTAGTAYTGVLYNADVPLLFSEIDPVQNNAVNTAVGTSGFSETQVWSRAPGVSAGPITSVTVNTQGTLYSVAPTVTISGTGSGATAVATLTGGAVTRITITNAGDGYAACTVTSASCPTPTVVTITPASTDTTGSGAIATAVVTLGGCGGGAHTCYPPAVNYTPVYYLINGQAFDRTSPSKSLFPATSATVTGSVLVRLVNAGLRMHVPSIVGSQTGTASGFSLIAEDGNPLPGVTRVQSEVFMAAGKTYDVMINAPATGAAALPVFDRQLSLSANSINRDGGMLAYLNLNGALAPSGGSIGVAAKANIDTYNSVIAGKTLTVSDVSKGVLANDVNVFGVKVLTGSGPTQGTLTLNPDGTFQYVANSTWATSDSFTYCGNGATTGPACAVVTLGPAPVETAAGNMTCPNSTFTASNAQHFAVGRPGVLTGCVDKAGYPLTVDLASVKPAAGLTVVADANGGFSADKNGAPPYTFTFNAQNSQGTDTASAATVTIVFQAANGPTVTVLDGADKKTVISDYRWIIEEDRTFFVDPKCTTNPLPAGCPTVTPQGAPAVFGTNFHTSNMPVVAVGCTGTLSCEGGQSINGVPVVCDAAGICSSGSQQTPLDPSQVHLDPTKRYYISVLPGDAANPFIGGNASAPVNCALGPYTDPKTGALNTDCGHGMGGAPLAPAQSAVTIYSQPSPYPPAKLTVFVFEDDYPLNGEHDASGGVDTIAPNEPGLGGFQITLQDDAGGTGDATGTPTYDMFNMPLTNSLAGTIDPITNLDACPISTQDTANTTEDPAKPGSGLDVNGLPVGSQKGIVGMIITCPKYESDGQTLSPLAGQAVVPNLYQGRYGVVANPAADRIARGEEWLQTNTLDGQKAHDSFMRIGEPAYFQEFGPGGYHVTIGFANPQIINDRRINTGGTGLCDAAPNGGGLSCTNEVKGHITTARMSRPPDERLYGSGSRDSFAFTQCYVSMGDPDGAEFAFVKCDPDGNFDFTGVPTGSWKMTVFDQWNDQIVDGISTPVGLSGASLIADLSSGGSGYTVAPAVTVSAPPCVINPPRCVQAVAVATISGGVVTGITFTNPGAGYTTPPTITVAPPPAGPTNTTASAAAAFGTDMGEVAVHQWQANIYTRTFFDLNHDGVSNKDANGNDLEPGLTLAATNIRFRDGSYSNFNNTDLNGYAGFNEVFPLFNWYVIETDTTRWKSTGVHVVYDAGGPTDTTCIPSTACGQSNIAAHFANTHEANPLPAALSVPGAVYCTGADCTGQSIANGPVPSSPSASTGRIDPPFWFGSYGWQGFSGQNSFLEFGKAPYADGENGGIHGDVIYASTRPFDDPMLLIQTSWTPMVPNVTVNLYKEGTAPDGSVSLTLVDTTQTSSFDAWAQGFRSDGVPNMNCPGQSTTDPFYFGLMNQPNYLDWYNSQYGGPAAKTLPANSQYKCYDGMHNWNQLQPAPYDGMYSFPSVTGLDPKTGRPTGTNCTACIPNPTHATVATGLTPATDPLYDPYRAGLPMLPAGKYVVEVVVPPGFELVKEEDKNILIGDNFIAPVTQQFGGLGSIFILPDQAAIGATFNPNNPQNSTTDLGRFNFPSTEADTGSVEQFWPCVGTARVVPDFLSLFPQAQEVSPFAGATRNLCDRKEVTVNNQAGALAKFWIFSSAHIASHFTGVITDDFTGEFDPFSPQFGEKFAPSYLPVSVKDWTGTEVNRVYSDEFGAYNGLNYSTWEVNPPNPTGYGPTMMVTCMNDPGTLATPDPLYQPNYSNFCYELAFMPGQTGYFDTPVVPTSAFSEGYNHPDCNYPDATPAIAEVDGDGVGPWVSAVGNTITITALGDRMVDNYGYSGPQSTNFPFNQQKRTRHYGFGSAQGTVTVGGVSLTNISWSDSTITGNVPAVPAAASTCPIQQQAIYGGQSAQCGQLLIVTASGQQSVDTVTVTIGGKAPTHIPATGSIQSAIDAAAPGDLLIVDPNCTPTVAPAAGTDPCTVAGTRSASFHNEMVLMWKPVRLQGVGAVSSIINANAHPAGKLDPWRKEVVCLFGLTIDGRPRSFTDQGCATNAGYLNLPGSSATFPSIIVDRVTLEAVLGWDASLNGNLAEQLIEPSLMGAYEGAGITVLGKGVNIPSASNDPFGANATTTAAFPTGTVLLTAGDCLDSTGQNPYPSNYLCNPSSIDGLTVTNSSQGGGGIFVHAWGHDIQIANNRVLNNMGTLSGGITVGQGEHVDVQLVGSAPLNDPASCETAGVLNQGLPFCYNLNVNVHNNSITLNSSLGDELFSSTPAGAGGVSFCNGADYYKFNYNWVCGNMSTGDGGGFAHIGFIKNGDIEHNTIIFNQSTNPTITTNGGGLLIMGAPDADPPCGVNTDKDCLPTPSSVAPSDGTGPGLLINANLILGNSADAGSGGGLRMQHVNGNDAINLPNGQTACPTLANCAWNSVNVTNNIIVNNVAGWDGAGVSLLDALAVNIVNDTIMSNDSTASAGTLFGSLFAPLASAPPSAGAPINCSTPALERSCSQVAGLVSDQNSPVLIANLPTAAAGFQCPGGHPSSGSSCRNYSVPLLESDIIWQNRSFYIGVGGFGSGTQNQQKTVALYNSFTTTKASSQPITGACDTDARYWDIGVRGNTSPTNTTGGSLPLYWSVISSGNYGNNNNSSINPNVVSQYCNGSRVPPENGSLGFTVVPGTNETNAMPLPVFTLTPSATVDEGNNWINMRWGPLSLTHPVSGAVLGNYALAQSSPAIDHIICQAAGACVPSGIPAAVQVTAPTKDFFGNPRPDPTNDGSIDVGAVENQHDRTAPQAPVLASINPNSGLQGSVVPVVINGTNLIGTTTTTVTVCTAAPVVPPVPCPGSGGVTATVTSVNSNTVTANFAISGTAAVGVRYVTVTTSAGTSNAVTFTVVAPSGTFKPSPLAFGNQHVGSTSTALTATFTNTTGFPITLRAGTVTGLGNANGPAVGITGTNANNFAIVAATTTCTNGAVIAVNGTCVINVTFTPSAAVARTAVLNIYAAGATTSFATDSLTGTGTQAVVAFAGGTNLTTGTANRNVKNTLTTITNTGNEALVISSFAIAVNAGQTNAGTFSVASPGTLGTTACPIGGTGLAPGAACHLTVTYTPPASPTPLVTINGTLTLTDTGAAAPTQTRGYTGN